MFIGDRTYLRRAFDAGSGLMAERCYAAVAGEFAPCCEFGEVTSIYDHVCPHDKAYTVSIRFTTYFLEVFENIWDKIWRN